MCEWDSPPLSQIVEQYVILFERRTVLHKVTFLDDFAPRVPSASLRLMPLHVGRPEYIHIYI